MFSIVSTGGHTAYNLQHFVIDTAAEMADLPIDVHVGSTVFIIENSKYYMLNGSNEWKEISPFGAGGTGGGGGGSESGKEVIYDGGGV